MSIAAVVTRGYGPDASIDFVTTRGYSIGAAVEPTPEPPTPSGGGEPERRISAAAWFDLFEPYKAPKRKRRGKTAKAASKRTQTALPSYAETLGRLAPKGDDLSARRAEKRAERALKLAIERIDAAAAERERQAQIQADRAKLLAFLEAEEAARFIAEQNDRAIELLLAAEAEDRAMIAERLRPMLAARAARQAQTGHLLKSLQVMLRQLELMGHGGNS